MKDSKYIGDELSIFKEAVNWKTYWYNSVKQYIKGDLLEVGAGIGTNINLFLQNNSDIRTILALEPDESLASQILANIKANTSKVKVQTGFLDDLTPLQKFDTIMYVDVIEHIKYDSEELNKAKLHLKEGGYLIILVPAYNFLFSPFDKAVGHYRRYNRRMLANSVPNDLTEITIFYLDSLGALASLFNKFILKQSYPTKNQIQKWDRLIVPTSKIVDQLLFNSVGKSLIGVWKK